MYPTAEVRWFQPGQVPQPVEAWFKEREPSSRAEPVRVDRYLQPTGGGVLNVKLRGGQLEIKRRLATGRQIRFAQEAVGLVERWRKWGFAIRETAEPDSIHVPITSDWVGVRKVRLLKTYDLRGGDVVSGRTSAGGCELELTRVEALGQAWWTLALEAFGDEATLLDTLVAVAEEALAAPCPFILRPGESFSYASWLATLSREEGM